MTGGRAHDRRSHRRKQDLQFEPDRPCDRRLFGLSFGTDEGGRVDLAEDLVELVLRVHEAGNCERADALRDDLEALGAGVNDDGNEPSYRL
ncbi:hypothetical protein [Halalkalicoccus subterraneus]|uniref:hypothetical protein n=1 Tax=Halalkalicoccus subterraneus TaxID=2675002 RepID=UPI001B88682B